MGLRQWLSNQIFFPGCAACDSASHAPLCSDCELSLYPQDTCCPRCAEPLEGIQPYLCHRCVRKPPAFSGTTAPYLYGGSLAEAVQRYKFRRRPDIIKTLWPLLAPSFRMACEDRDLLVPTPLSLRRECKRGFNQAALLTHVADVDIPRDLVSLRRIRHTATQTGLSRRQRILNVANAFAVPARRRRHIAGQRILLVDDVFTTGATAAAAARALRSAGARCVTVYCIARAEYRS